MMQTPAVRAPLDTDLSMHGRLGAPIGVQLGTLASVALASFLLGVAASHAYGQYARHVDCQRWQESVKGWSQVVDDASGELTSGENAALTLAHGGLIAVKDQVCGY